MKKLALLCLLTAVCAFGSVTISDNLATAVGGPVGGTVTSVNIYAPAFLSPDGNNVSTVNVNVPVASDGSFSYTLHPNAVGGHYVFTYTVKRITNGTSALDSYYEQIVVPNVTGTITLLQCRTSGTLSRTGDNTGGVLVPTVEAVAQNTPLKAANNLGDLLNPALARSYLGLTSVATMPPSGDGSSVATVSGTLTPGFCLQADATGNVTVASAACGTGGGGGGSYTLPVASASTLGGVKQSTGLAIDGTGLASVNYGTTAGTAAQGNDSRITGALQKSSNLSDLASIPTALANLGIGSAGLQASSAFDAAGAASAVQSASLQKSANLSDLASASSARTALGLGTAATHATTDFDAAGAAATVQALIPTNTNQLTNGSGFLVSSNNLSDLASPATARGALGLGTAATSNTTAFDAAGAATTAQNASLQKSANLSDLANAATARGNLGVSTVGHTGAYSDLTGTPTIPTNTNQLTNGSGFIVGSNNLSDLTNIATAKTNLSLATVATSGSYNDLSNKPSIPSAYTLPNATTSTLGGVIVGTGLGVNAGTVSVTYGTASNTAAVGNDTRITGALQAANNLSDINSASAARTSLGLATVASSGSYADLSNKPTVYNQTVQVNGTPVTQRANVNLAAGSNTSLSASDNGTDTTTVTITATSSGGTSNPPGGATNAIQFNGGSSTFAGAINSTTTKEFLTQTNSGAPSFSTISNSDLPGTLTANTSGTAANVSGTVAVANGGTGQTSAANAFNALSPLTALGDLLYGGASGAGTRLAGNTTTTRQYLMQTGNGTVSAAPVWGAIASGDLPSSIAANTSGNAATATALAANPTDCSSNQFANAIAANGNLTCSAVSYSQLSGTLASTSLSDSANLVRNNQINTYANQSSPGANPTSGNAIIWTDATGKNLQVLNDLGTVSVTAIPKSSTTHQFLTALASNGTLSAAQPSASDVSGLAASATTDTTNAGNISAGTLSAARLPNPTGTTLGGVESYASVSHQFLTSISTSGVPASAQPSAADVSGLAASATTDTTNASNISSGTLNSSRLPVIASTTLSDSATLFRTTDANTAAPATPSTGNTAVWTDSTDKILKAKNDLGTISITVVPQTATSHQFVTALSSAGVFSQAQPAATDITGLAASATVDTTNAANISSGTLGAARLPNPSASTLGGVESIAAVSHKWVNAISTSGVPSLTQPAAADITGLAASATTDTTSATNISSGTLSASRLPSTVVQTNQANTYTSGTQNFSSVSFLPQVSATSPGTCTLGQVYFNTAATAGQNWYFCTATNTWTQQIGPGSVGTTGTITTGALVTAASTSNIQTPSATATLDSSGNLSVPGSISVSGANAGGINFAQGAAQTAGTNSVGFQAPTSVTSAFLFTLPGAPAAGVLHATNATPSVLSASAVSLTADVSGLLPIANGGNGTSSPGVQAGTNVSVTGSWPTQTISVPNLYNQTIENAGTPVTQRAKLSFAGANGITVTPTDNGTDTSTFTFGVTGYQASGNYITALTGDGTASGPGSAALTVAKVNGGAIPVSANLVGTNSSGQFIANSSTYLTANQTITLTGDTTGSGSTAITTTTSKVNGGSIPVSAVVLGSNSSNQIVAASIANNTILGNVSGSTGAPSALTSTQATTLCNAFTASLSGCVPASGGGTTNYLRADGTWSAPGGGSMVYPGAGIAVSTGSAWGTSIAASSVPTWVKYTVAYTSLTAASTTQQITLFTLPAKGKIQGITVKHSTAFTGSGLTAMTVSVGDSGTPAGYAPAFDVFQTVSNTAYYDDGGNFSLTFASDAVVAAFTSTGANLGNGSTTSLTAGSVDIWVLWSTLP